MVKRFLSLCCTLVLLFCLTPAAHADVLWTPDNAFFETHYDDCTYVGRSYYANGEEGYVTLWDAPDGAIVTGQYQNGFTLHVYWLYEDWGCITVWGDEERVEGWVPMSNLALIYDYICFAEEHAEQIKDYNGEFSGYADDSNGIVFREYPGAPAPKLVWDYDDITPQLTGSEDGYSYISQIFTDEDGLTWGYVGYLYGNRNLWFCLDDPKGETLPAQQESSSATTETAPPADGVELIPPQEPQLPSAALLPYILVGCVVVVTAALLLWFRARKKTDHTQDAHN